MRFLLNGSLFKHPLFSCGHFRLKSNETKASPQWSRNSKQASQRKTTSDRHHSRALAPSFLSFGHFSPGLISPDRRTGQHNCRRTTRHFRRPRDAESCLQQNAREGGSTHNCIIKARGWKRSGGGTPSEAGIETPATTAATPHDALLFHGDSRPPTTRRDAGQRPI